MRNYYTKEILQHQIDKEKRDVSLNNRIKILLKSISAKKYITAEELAKKLNISSKTVRTTIKDLNNLLTKSGGEIVSKSGYGYILKITNGELFSKLDLTNKRKVLPDTSEKRIQYIIEYLINTDNYIKVEKLSEMLFTSPKTLSKDLKEVEKIFSSYNIELKRKPYYGIKAEGEEFDFRLCIANYIEMKTNGNMNLINENELKKNSSSNNGHIKKRKI
nr:HTH domain-containing protein [Leptotrichia trevisanii]